MKCMCLQQGEMVQQAYMDIYKLFGPIFNGIADDVLSCEARIDSKVDPWEECSSCPASLISLVQQNLLLQCTCILQAAQPNRLACRHSPGEASASGYPEHAPCNL